MTGAKRYATCPACGQPMVPGGACTANPGGNRIPWGREYGMPPAELRNEWREQPWDCHDCNARPGGLHHSGCDTEECPICHRQALGCPHACEGGVFTR